MVSTVALKVHVEDPPVAACGRLEEEFVADLLIVMVLVEVYACKRLEKDVQK